MAMRAPHGRAAELGSGPRIEVAADALPRGVHAVEQVEARTERTPDGRFTKQARTAQSKGGRTRKGTTTLAVKLGVGDIVTDPAFIPYRRAANDFRRTHCASLARSVGGGECGPGPSSIVASAALQLAASRRLFDLAAAGGDPQLFVQASRLADASRQNLLAAHELCAREAATRPRENPMERLRREIAEAAQEHEGASS